MFCPWCKTFNEDGLERCTYCRGTLKADVPSVLKKTVPAGDATIVKRRGEIDTDPELELEDKPAEASNRLGTLAYHLGVFSMIPLVSIVLAPPAIILGILGLKRARLLPGSPGRYHALVGIACGILGILGTIVVLMLERQGVLTFDRIRAHLGID